MVKNPPASTGNTGEAGSIPGMGGSPGDGNGDPLQYSCLENPMVRRRLMGYSPRGCKGSDMTEHTHPHTHTHTTYMLKALTIMHGT